MCFDGKICRGKKFEGEKCFAELKEAKITLRFMSVDDILSSQGTCPTSPGQSAWGGEQTGSVHRSPELCAWTWCWKIHILVLHEVSFNQVLRRHLEFGSTLVGSGRKEGLCCAFYFSFFLRTVQHGF